MKLITSESVTSGHPDKICDQIADNILVECLKQDPDSHVACEVCCTTNNVILLGEITTKANVDYEEVTRSVLESIGYTDAEYGIDARKCIVTNLIEEQSSEINDAVNKSLELRGPDEIEANDVQGAGDQGIIFGYACKDTSEYLPLSLFLSDSFARKIEEVRMNGVIPWLRPDGKVQVTIKESIEPFIDTLLISVQHDPEVDHDTIYEEILFKVITPVLQENDMMNMIRVGEGINCTKLLINPSGSFTIGGPHGDTGLTGRKLAVDTYGGCARFGGGALSGKDPSKVDRSAAYMTRYVAKHIVAAGLADSCEIQIAYAIGKARELALNVDTRRTGNLPDSMIESIIKGVFDFRPYSITETLKLKSVNYKDICYRSHFMNQSMPWEILDNEIIDKLKDYLHKYQLSYTND